MSKSSYSPILVADDDSVTRELIAYKFKTNGYKTELAEDGEELLALLSADTQVAIIDLKMPGINGIECMQLAKKEFPNLEVIILTSVNEATEAMNALKKGAFDYITKPFDIDELLHAVKRALQVSRATLENDSLKDSPTTTTFQTKMVGSAPAIQKISKILPKISESTNSVLITGESGTGKGVLARTIHSLSPRKDKPFITVSCPALPRELLESEMFGHEKGAFSGALQKRIGRAEMANGGTLFLDEIGDMPLDLQPKLLNFIQDREFYRIGGQKLIESDVRIIAATNVEMLDKIEQGLFREDLYFRLNVLPVNMPSLSDRIEDIPDLVEYFLSKHKDMGSLKVEKEAMNALMAYTWPGNIRELENVVSRAVTYCSNGIITTDDLPPEILSPRRIESNDSESSSTSSNNLGGLTLNEIERMAIIQTLELTKGNKAEAARRLGITEKSIYNKLKRHDIKGV